MQRRERHGRRRLADRCRPREARRLGAPRRGKRRGENRILRGRGGSSRGQWRRTLRSERRRRHGRRRQRRRTAAYGRGCCRDCHGPRRGRCYGCSSLRGPRACRARLQRANPHGRHGVEGGPRRRWTRRTCWARRWTHRQRKITRQTQQSADSTALLEKRWGHVSECPAVFPTTTAWRSAVALGGGACAAKQRRCQRRKGERAPRTAPRCWALPMRSNVRRAIKGAFVLGDVARPVMQMSR
jgi:hypothetical protein